MKWATRAGVQIDRALPARLMCRFVDPLSDPALWRIAEIVTEADVDDERFDAPEARWMDVVLRGLSMVCDDDQVLPVTRPMFDGLYELFRRELLLGREPS